MDTNEQLELLDDLLLGPVKSIFPAPLTQEERVAVNAYLVLSHAVLEEQLEEAFEWGSFEQVLSQELADLTTLGARRGEAGHLSPFSGKAVILNQQEYPEDARRWVRAAGAALARIIRHLDSLIVEQQPNTLICDWDGN